MTPARHNPVLGIMVREVRWPQGVCCPFCGGVNVIKCGHDENQEHRLRYGCKPCGWHFDDLIGTVFENHHQPLQTWILCSYFTGLNLSNAQIGQESEALLRLVWARSLNPLVHGADMADALRLKGEAGRWVSLPATR